jgi:predicted phosphodiesterase
MKYLIVSDIHGAFDSAEFIINEFNKEKCDYILLLGDVLYHGPRNDLPAFYNPEKVISILNPYKDKIICVKGNCEAEVDQMVLDFKILDSFDGIINDI